MTTEHSPTPTDTSQGSPDFEGSPMHRYFGVRLVDPDRRHLGCWFIASESAQGREGQLNGGVLSLLLDATAYLALEPSLGPDEDAVSHDLHISMLRSVMVGQRVDLRGELVQRGRRVAFVNSEARVDGRLVATARITKTIVQKPAATA